MSDFLDVCLESNTTPNEDVKFNIIGADLDKIELDYTREMLLADYNITLETSEIIDLMEEYGIDTLEMPIGESLHDIIYDALQETV